MSHYEPTSRRPIADVFRLTADAATGFCVRRGIHPDTISYMSIVFAAAAALCFWRSDMHPMLLLVAPGFCYLRLWCNMLDGMVALATGKASWRGEILNDLPDRVSDVVIFAGAAHSGWMHPLLGYWAAIACLLAAYVGMLGQAVGVPRAFGGMMSKPWRMVMLHIRFMADPRLFLVESGRAAVRHGDGARLDVRVNHPRCVQTMAVRLRRTMAALRAK